MSVSSSITPATTSITGDTKVSRRDNLILAVGMFCLVCHYGVSLLFLAGPHLFRWP